MRCNRHHSLVAQFAKLGDLLVAQLVWTATPFATYRIVGIPGFLG